VDKISRHSRVRFANVRRSDLPQKESAGRLRALGIHPHSGLAEQIHVVFFEDDIVGADFNFYGPRLPKLGGYLCQKAKAEVPRDLHFEALLRQDVMEKLDALAEIRLFDLRIRKSYATKIAEADRSLADAFEAASTAGSADVVEIVLRTPPHSKGWLNRHMLDVSRKILQLPELRHEAANFHVKGYDVHTQQVVELDLLSDKLIATESIVQVSNRTRALENSSAYKAIENAHLKLKDELHQAASVAVDYE
jgi:hypothetical protein